MKVADVDGQKMLEGLEMIFGKCEIFFVVLELEDCTILLEQLFIQFQCIVIQCRYNS